MDEDFLEYGYKAVEAGNEAVEYGKDTPKKKINKQKAVTMLIIANGYNSYGSNVAREIKDLEDRSWLPQTVDFQKTATDIAGNSFHGASEVKEFIGALQSVPLISRLIFVGHGSRRGLGLKGGATSLFEEEFDEAAISQWQSTIDSDIKNRFTEDAVFDIIACNLGIDGGFAAKLATAFNIRIRAFDKPLYWCASYDKTNNTVTGRGKITTKEAFLKKYGDNPQVSCSDDIWLKGISKLKFPKEIKPENGK